VTIYGDGKQSRDFTLYENIVQANLLASNRAPRQRGQRKESITWPATRHSLLETHQRLCALMGRSDAVVYARSGAGDIRHSVQISTATGSRYHLSVNFIEGLRRTVAWHESHNKNDRSALLR